MADAAGESCGDRTFSQYQHVLGAPPLPARCHDLGLLSKPGQAASAGAVPEFAVPKLWQNYCPLSRALQTEGSPGGALSPEAPLHAKREVCRLYSTASSLCRK